ncbi:FAD:protein FMN transferase [bacterium]|nr:FAD:protein FMN transferase [bacterium]
MKKFRALIFVFLIFFISGCGKKEYSKVEFLMDTVVEIKVYYKRKAEAEKAINSSMEEMKRVEQKMSCFFSGSEVSRINKDAFLEEKKGSLSVEGWIPVSDELFSLLGESVLLSKLTKGCFDITIYPLWKIWKFEGENIEVPGKGKIERVLELVTYKNMILQNGKISFAKKGMGIDLGGIAKGYAVDAAIKVLKDKNIKSAMVNAGGDMYVLGKKEGKPWRIGIRHPRREGEILGTVEVENRAIVTSGDYERFFFSGGKKYHHIINPKTGYPADECQSVTIVAKEATFADGLATGIFVLGPKEGMALIENLEGVEGVIVNKEGDVSVSSGLISKIEYVN